MSERLNRDFRAYALSAGDARCLTDHLDAWRLDALRAAQIADRGRVIPLADDDELDHEPTLRRGT